MSVQHLSGSGAPSTKVLVCLGVAFVAVAGCGPDRDRPGLIQPDQFPLLMALDTVPCPHSQLQGCILVEAEEDHPWLGAYQEWFQSIEDPSSVCLLAHSAVMLWMEVGMPGGGFNFTYAEDTHPDGASFGAIVWHGGATSVGIFRGSQGGVTGHIASDGTIVNPTGLAATLLHEGLHGVFPNDPEYVDGHPSGPGPDGMIGTCQNIQLPD